MESDCILIDPKSSNIQVVKKTSLNFAGSQLLYEVKKDIENADKTASMKDQSIGSTITKIPSASVKSDPVESWGKIPIWTGKKHKSQMDIDEKATLLFLRNQQTLLACKFLLLFNKLFCILGIVKDNWTLLSDSTTRKPIIWEAIGAEMATLGYDLIENSTSKAEVKWNNLYSRYKNFIRDTEKTGSGGDVWENAPKFCNEIRAVLRSFHICIVCLIRYSFNHYFVQKKPMLCIQPLWQILLMKIRFPENIK